MLIIWPSEETRVHKLCKITLGLKTVKKYYLGSSYYATSTFRWWCKSHQILPIIADPSMNCKKYKAHLGINGDVKSYLYCEINANRWFIFVLCMKECVLKICNKCVMTFPTTKQIRRQLLHPRIDRSITSYSNTASPLLEYVINNSRYIQVILL